MLTHPIRLLPSVVFFFALVRSPASANDARAKTDTLSIAIFAGGSFWCLEPAFEALPGVIAAVSGYAGGTDTNPTFDAVSEGKTGHVEAVEVRYNSRTIGYAKLLDAYWRNIDPTRRDGQFSDVGPQFRTVIFYRDDIQKRLAQASKQSLEKSRRFGKGKHVVTEISPAAAFYPAEEKNQDFYKKNPSRYRAYRMFSGRDAFFRKVWGTPPTG